MKMHDFKEQQPHWERANKPTLAKAIDLTITHVELVAKRRIGDEALTKWTNPTEQHVRERLFLHPLHQNEQKMLTKLEEDQELQVIKAQVSCIFEIPPGGSIELPSIYDNAIVQVRDGMIVGGICPFLIKEGCRMPPLAAALDPKEPHV